MDTTVRTISTDKPAPQVNNFKENKVGAQENIDSIEPVENTEEYLLSTLGVDDLLVNLPEEDKSYLSEISSYLKDMLSKDGINPTKGAYDRALNKLKESLNLDPDTDASTAIKKIGGLVKSWKSISFIKDLGERKRILSKLSQAESVESMDKLIFDEMNKLKIWQ